MNLIFQKTTNYSCILLISLTLEGCNNNAISNSMEELFSKNIHLSKNSTLLTEKTELYDFLINDNDTISSEKLGLEIGSNYTTSCIKKHLALVLDKTPCKYEEDAEEQKNKIFFNIFNDKTDKVGRAVIVLPDGDASDLLKTTKLKICSYSKSEIYLQSIFIL